MPALTLSSLKYSEKVGIDGEWTLDLLSLGHINLIVGKNATGKSRILNVLGNLSKSLTSGGKIQHPWGCYDLEFSSPNGPVRYTLSIEDNCVKKERLTINGDAKLDRTETDLRIYGEEYKQLIKFVPSPKEISAVARKDDLQHPFLNSLFEWANGVRHYHFGSFLGREHLSFTVDPSAADVIKGQSVFDDRDEDQVVEIFIRAEKQFQAEYVNAVKSDMAQLGYQLDDIFVTQPSGIKIKTQLPFAGSLNALAVREPGVKGTIFQHELSQGMFRALSILVQVNYSQLAKRAHLILIDDIGEGLDFDRSSKLINVLRNKSLDSAFQLVMTTNDQFVMNHIPLEEWSVLERNGSHVRVFNYANSAERFEEFKFLGMTNFTLLETNFITQPPDDGDSPTNE